MQVDNKVISKIEEILKQANLESTLSLEALQQVVKLKEDFQKGEDRIILLKEENQKLNEKISKLESEKNTNEKIIKDFKAREDALKQGELKLLEENFKLKYFQSRGDEMKEIVGMALRNTEVRKMMFNNVNTTGHTDPYNTNTTVVASENITETVN